MSPRLHFWVATLFTLFAVSLTFSLGWWQLNRAAQKQKLSAEQHQIIPSEFSGYWLVEKTLYLDNRQMAGRQGFFVITPLLMSNNEYVLVERGWIQRDFLDRKRLQPIQTPTKRVTIRARVIPEPAQPAVFANHWDEEYPIVQYMDITKMKAQLNQLQYQGIAQQISQAGEGAGEGLKRDWYEPATGVEKNYGYAFQWFAMCAVVVGLYIWFQWIKPLRKTKTASTQI